MKSFNRQYYIIHQSTYVYKYYTLNLQFKVFFFILK